MTTVFADASALVKHYLPEPESPLVSDVLTKLDVVISELSTVEGQSAIWRWQRAGAVSQAKARRLCRQLLADTDPPNDTAGGTIQIEITPAVRKRAGVLLARYPLRANDAVQLASALTARDALPDIVFFCFDQALCEAAEQEGLEVFPPVA